jgi:hypothetical protein
MEPVAGADVPRRVAQGYPRRYRAAMRFDRRLLRIGIAASMLVHLVLVLSAPIPRARNKRAESLMEFSLEAPSAPRVFKEASPATNLARKAAAPTVKRRRVASAAAATPYAPRTPFEAEPSAAVASPASSPPLAAPVTPAAAALKLSPFAAARALPSGNRAETCNLRERSADAHCDDDGQAGAEAAERALDQVLRQSARTPAHLAEREPPRLTRTADGGYLYVNHFDGSYVTFTARITPDGEVQFTDASNVQFAPVPVSGIFDTDDALMGGPLHTAEKRWFLEQTETLRRQLADAARSAEARRAHVALERAFERIMQQALSPQQKRDAVFELWQDCGNDSARLSVRSWVEVLIRRWMPRGSALGFDDAYLEQHNRGLPVQDHFDPYRGSSPG